MADYKLEAQTREELGKNVQFLREQMLIPAVVYGGKKNFNIKVSKSPFDKVFATAGESSIIDLVIDEKNTIPVVVKDIQRHPTTHEIIHVDFYEVDMNKEIVATVPLVFTGEAPAIKSFGGVLSTSIDQVEIKCLPANLIHEIKVDLNILDELDKSIHVGDLDIPENIQFVTNSEVIIAKVAEQKIVEEEVEETADVADVEVEGEKKDGEEKEGSTEGEKKEEKKEDQKS